MLVPTPLKIESGKETVTDVVIFEQGDYRNPMKIITDYEAMHFAINLANCLSKDKIQMIVDTLNKTLSKGE